MPQAGKRAIDLLLGVPLLLLLLPLMLLVAAAIRLDSPGPVLFRQMRRGRQFRPFTLVKFRSLRLLPDPRERYEMEAQDPRITRIGAFLRRTSLDELPQLLNVLAGSMSLVGPRPLVEWESRDALVTHPARFRVKPGITGLSQVAVRNSVGFLERLNQDVEYVERWSLLLDLRILLRTPWCLLHRDSIYPATGDARGRHDSSSA